MRIICLFILLSLSAFSADTIKCTSDFGDIVLTPSTKFFSSSVAKKCAKHSKGVYDWETFAYYKLSIDDLKFSGIVCNEDVKFEFQSAQKLFDTRFSVLIYLDELKDSSYLKIDGKTYSISCEYL